MIRILLFFASVSLCSLVPFQNSWAQEAIELSEQAKKIHLNGYVWDGHNDLPWAARERNDIKFEKMDLWNEPKLHTDIPRLRTGNVGAQFWSVFVPAKTRQAGTAFQTTMEQIDCVYAMVKKYPDVFEIALMSSFKKLRFSIPFLGCRLRCGRFV